MYTEKGLARMHALAIAVRLQHANVFNEKFRPFLTPIDLNASTGTNVSFNVSHAHAPEPNECG